MYKNKSILAVCPARGGSKGLPRKNVLPLCGRPLTSWVGAVVQLVPEIDRSIVSTDSPEIANVAREAGLDAPFLRPEDLSGDRVADLPVLQHALNFMEDLDSREYDVVLMLQPTSPLRKPSQIKQAIQTLIDLDLDSVWSVSAVDSKFHPLKQLTIRDENLQLFHSAGKAVVARQQLSKTYIRNGVVYAIGRRCLLELNSIMGSRSRPLIIEEPVANIDVSGDFEVAERQFLEMGYPDLLEKQ